jgi:hypothetical protein
MFKNNSHACLKSLLHSGIKVPTFSLTYCFSATAYIADRSSAKICSLKHIPHISRIWDLWPMDCNCLAHEPILVFFMNIVTC